MYSSLLKHASSACANLTNEAEIVLSQYASGSSDRASAIAEYLVRILNSPGEYLFVDLSRWHWQVGRLLLFKTLFSDYVQDECIHTIEGELSTIAKGFSGLDGLGFADSLDKVFGKELDAFKNEYGGAIESMLSESEKFSVMDKDSLDHTFDDIEDLLYEPRYDAELIFIGASVLKRPRGNREWIDAFRDHDSSLMTILTRYHRRDRELKGARKVREDVEVLRRDRFVFPPELFPWMWVDLVEEEMKPLDAIFDFEPEEVKKKLEKIGQMAQG